MNKNNWKGFNMKKTVAMLFVLAMLVSSVAGAESILVMPKLVGIPYFNASEAGAMAAGEELGIDVVFAGPEKEEADLQVQMIEEKLAEGYDAIAIAPTDPDAVSQALQACKDSGMLVIDWDSAANAQDVTYSVHQIDDRMLGEMLIDLMVNKMGAEGEYAIITGNLDAANMNAWIQYGQDYAAEAYPGLKLVADPVASNDSQQEAYDQAMALIQAHPDLKGIVGYSSPAPIGAAMAVRELGLNDQITVVGTSMPNDSNEYLKDGSLDYGLLWDPAQLGKLAVYVAHLALNGEPLEGYEVPGVGQIHVEADGKTIIMGPLSVWTAENVDNYDF